MKEHCLELINHNQLIFSDDKNQLQIEFVHSHLKEAYWSKGIL